VRRTEALLEIADRLQMRYERANEQTVKLTQSILSKAFRDELVPTEAELAKAEGRSYETTEELLTRIHRDNTSAAKNSRLPLGLFVSGRQCDKPASVASVQYPLDDDLLGHWEPRRKNVARIPPKTRTQSDTDSDV
jgi:hypothetical protein